MTFARGPCDGAVSSSSLISSSSSCVLCSSNPSLGFHPARERILTHLLPLPETVMGLVESLPCGNVVLAVETGEVAAFNVSMDCVLLQNRDGVSGDCVGNRGKMVLTYTRRAMVARILAGADCIIEVVRRNG